MTDPERLRNGIREAVHGWARHLFGPADEPDEPGPVVVDQLGQRVRLYVAPDGSLVGVIEPKEETR